MSPALAAALAFAVLAIATALVVRALRLEANRIPPCLICGAALEFVPDETGRGVEHRGQRGWWLCSKRQEHASWA